MHVRNRYAPSPTGLQHIGGIRTALFNYLFAQAEGGAFILRLEDTDRVRSDGAFVQNLYDTFAWLNLRWNEGPDVGGPYAPYIQSERLAEYREAVNLLLENGKAYYCFCASERLEKIRREQEASGSAASGYDRHCRTLDVNEARERAKTEPHVIRLKIPLEGSTVFTDKLLGEITWKNDAVNPDPVLLKSDGYPTYHLANVVDDHAMRITHVMRAQEWLSSTPLHIMLYQAFGWKEPLFCHLPMVMGQDGKKLSKRHGATSIDEFRKNGLLPQALLNYIALLGASYGEDAEMLSLSELAARFSLDKLNKAPAVFDYKKLEWFNAQYIKQCNDAELAALALPFAKEARLFGGNAGAPDASQHKLFVQAMPLIKERANYLTEIAPKLQFLFDEPPLPARDVFIPKKAGLEDTVKLLKLGQSLVERLAAFDDAAAEALVKECAEREGVRLGDLLMPLRVAVTGARVSPPLFGSLRLLGARRSADRVARALASLSGAEA